jgi:short-subunit dehydrogenase
MTCLPRLLERKKDGHLVVTSSTAGLTAVNGAAAYCAAKFAVTGLMETLAGELDGTGIDVSIFCPGPVQTDIGANLEKVRPPHLRNGHVIQDPISPDDGSASALFMTPDEVGRRVLSGMRRRDLYILSHPEFGEGMAARSAALARAVPDEPINHARADLLRQFGTLLINPVYSSQKPVTFDQH